VCRASRTLNWDLGDTHGTVAVRMPMQSRGPGPAQGDRPAGGEQRQPATGGLAATTAADAEEQLGDAVSVYLDGGPCDADVPSTIVDLTGDVPRLLRAGAVSVGAAARGGGAVHERRCVAPVTGG